MIHITSLTRQICLTLFVLCLSLSASAQKTLTILHTNDVHSRMEAVDANSADTVSADRGGFIRLAACVESMRKIDPGLLLLDAGDFSQGTPYYNLFKGEVEIKMMNSMKYDAGTIGNHEFDFGMENMARLFRMANHPIVCCNYDVEGTVLEGLVQPYVIIEKKGIKIGVIGVGYQLEGMVQANKCEGVTYHIPYERVTQIATELKAKGCAVVICLSHLGLRASRTNPVCDIELAKQCRNVDLIIGGHSHTLMEEPLVEKNSDNKDVYISQMGKSGIFLGRFDLTLE